MFQEPLRGERKLNFGRILLIAFFGVLCLTLANFYVFSGFSNSNALGSISSFNLDRNYLTTENPQTSEHENKLVYSDSSDAPLSSSPVSQSQTSSKDKESNPFKTASTAQSKPITSNKPSSSGRVQVSGRDILVDGKAFKIKGVAYAPVPIGGSPGVWPDNIGTYDRDFMLLNKMGANSIRTWGKVSSTLLDRAQVYNISVIAGYWVDTSIDLSNPTTRTNLINDFKSYVSQYKDKPALLMWAIGNENNYHNGNNAAWYSLVNEMAQAAYTIEGSSYHPVAIVNGDINNVGDSSKSATDAQMDYVDVWGANVYRGLSFGTMFSQYTSKSSKPLWISEYGIDSYDNRIGAEYRAVQAQYDSTLWNEIAASTIAVGGTVMEYSDEYWKSGTPLIQDTHGEWANSAFPDGYGNEEYWGLLAIQDNGASPDIMKPKEAYYSMRDAFRGYNNAPALNISDMTVNAGDIATLQLASEDSDGDPLIYTISAPFSSSGTWQTQVADIGAHSVTVSATDGVLSDSKTIIVNVIQKPIIPECLQFYDPLEDSSTIQANNGTIYGDVSFVQGFRGNGAKFSNDSYIRYNGDKFNHEYGSVSFWFKKNPGSNSGGIWQIGQIGTENSLGLFYNNDSDVFLEMRASGTTYYSQATSLGKLSETNYTHFVISWDNRKVNGLEFWASLYADGTTKTGEKYFALAVTPFVFSSGMDIGRTGFYGGAKGIIDDLRYFDYELNWTQAEDLYDYELGRYNNASIKCVNGNNTLVFKPVFGDANRNAEFGMDDLNYLVDVLLLRIAAPDKYTNTFESADVNGDGILNLIDLNIYVDRLLGRITKFPVEN